MKKLLTIKKGFEIKLRQVKEGLYDSNNAVGWKTKVESGMSDLVAALNKDEQLDIIIEKENTTTINSN
jgi:hypothetical protein